MDEQLDVKEEPVLQEQRTSPLKTGKNFLFKHINKILVVLNILACILFVYLFLAKPYEISGNPIAALSTSKYVLTSKVSYLIKDPKIGDRIIFLPDGYTQNFVGIIIAEETFADEKTYQVASSNERIPWSIRNQNIRAKIYYPFLNESKEKDIVKVLLSPPTQAPSTTASPSPTIHPSLAASTEDPSPTTNPASSMLPNGEGGISVGYYNPAKPQRESTISPPGAKMTLRYNKTGYTKTYTDSPNFVISKLPPGAYTLSVSPLSGYDISNSTSYMDKTGKVINSPSTAGTSLTINLAERGYISVYFGFTPKTNSSTSQDSTQPKMTNISGPVNLWDANSDHGTAQRDFCITLSVEDNTTPVEKIETNVQLLKLNGSFSSEYAYSSGWTTSKQHCFTGLQDMEYQINMDVRDEAGNIGSYATNVRVF